MKSLNHKGTGIPSRNFMTANLEKYKNQRIQFELLHSIPNMVEFRRDWLDKFNTRVSINTTDPIYVNAIYMFLNKKSKRSMFDYQGHAEPLSFEFVFKDPVFIQNGQEFTLTNRKYNKKYIFKIFMDDMGSCPLVTPLRIMNLIGQMEVQLLNYYM